MAQHFERARERFAWICALFFFFFLLLHRLWVAFSLLNSSTLVFHCWCFLLEYELPFYLHIIDSRLIHTASFCRLKRNDFFSLLLLLHFSLFCIRIRALFVSVLFTRFFARLLNSLLHSIYRLLAHSLSVHNVLPLCVYIVSFIFSVFMYHMQLDVHFFHIHPALPLSL